MRLIAAAVLLLGSAAPAWAHSGAASEQPAGRIVVWLGLALLAACYAAGVRRLWRHGRGPVRRGHAAAFAAAWVALAAALIWPLDGWSGVRFWAHMAQHQLLLLVAAPLLVVAKASLAVPVGFPRCGRWLARAVAAIRMGPVSAWALHGLTLWLWHLPGPYQAALQRPALHALEHLTLFGTAVLFWWALLRGGPRRYGLAAALLFATVVHTGLLGALLTFAPRPWYPAYLPAEGAGLTALEDQQLAGLIMWVPGGLILTAGGLALAGAWLRAATPPRLRAAALIVAVLALAGGLMGCGSQQAAAARISGGDPDRGKMLITRYGCYTCHTIPGVPGANAMVGPPLTKVAKRAYVAGQPNSPENLIRWLQHPRSVRPSTPMPEMGVTEPDSRDIAAYLYTLG